LTPRNRRVALLLAAALMGLTALAAAPPQPSPKEEAARQMRFGTEMARQGNWREAVFRWKRALALDPDNPRLRNNLAVAYESLGEYDRADAEYRAAAASGKAPPEALENQEMFRKFYGLLKKDEDPQGKAPPPGPAAALPVPSQPAPAAPPPAPGTAPENKP
jgi:Flp pilus assembly protein TadD